jgi:hypothetical protein
MAKLTLLSGNAPGYTLNAEIENILSFLRSDFALTLRQQRPKNMEKFLTRYRNAVIHHIKDAIQSSEIEL